MLVPIGKIFPGNFPRGLEIDDSADPFSTAFPGIADRILQSSLLSIFCKEEFLFVVDLIGVVRWQFSLCFFFLEEESFDESWVVDESQVVVFCDFLILVCRSDRNSNIACTVVFVFFLDASLVSLLDFRQDFIGDFVKAYKNAVIQRCEMELANSTLESTGAQF